MQNSFDGVFYVQNAPNIRYEDGLFFVSYEVGKIRAEFVMRPSIYLKALRAADKTASAFHARDENVSRIKSKATH